MTRITLLDPAAAQGEAARALASPVGHLALFRALAHAPANILPVMRLGGTILASQKLDARRRELLILLAMQIEGGRYEWAQHVDIALGVGATEAEIAAIEEGRVAADCFDEADRALLAFGRAVVENVRVPDDLFTAARHYFDEREVVEAILAIGFYMMLARVTEALEIEQDPVQGMAVLASSRSRAAR